MPTRTTRAEGPRDMTRPDIPSFAVTVDVVILTMAAGWLQVLLVRRGQAPFQDMWAIPGGFKRSCGDAGPGGRTGAARRDRCPRPRACCASSVPTVIRAGTPAWRRDRGLPRRGSRCRSAHGGHRCRRSRARACPGRAPGQPRAGLRPPAHRGDALARVRLDLELTGIATAFVGPTFTLAELRRVYEAVWDVRLDAANFRRHVAAEDGWVMPTGQRVAAGPTGGRPAELYRAGRAWETTGPIQRRQRRETLLVATMRAVVHDRYGSPDVLRLETVERPVPAPDEVLIHVHSDDRQSDRLRLPCRARPSSCVRSAAGGVPGSRSWATSWRVSSRVSAVASPGSPSATGCSGSTSTRSAPTPSTPACARTGPLATMPDGMTFADGAAMCDGFILALTLSAGRRPATGPAHPHLRCHRIHRHGRGPACP